jgi:hypothetical protein
VCPGFQDDGSSLVQRKRAGQNSIKLFSLEKYERVFVLVWHLRVWAKSEQIQGHYDSTDFTYNDFTYNDFTYNEFTYNFKNR